VQEEGHAVSVTDSSDQPEKHKSLKFLTANFAKRSDQPVTNIFDSNRKIDGRNEYFSLFGVTARSFLVHPESNKPQSTPLALLKIKIDEYGFKTSRFNN
jgi:hypothetical protein